MKSETLSVGSLGWLSEHPFLAQEALTGLGYSHITPLSRGKVAIKWDRLQKQEIYMVKKGKVGYFGFSVSPEGRDPLKVPPGGSSLVRTCGAQKRLQATLPLDDHLEGETPP